MRLMSTRHASAHASPTPPSGAPPAGQAGWAARLALGGELPYLPPTARPL